MAEKHSMLTQERLKELIRYYPETGSFVWIDTRRNRNGSSPPGHVTKRGYTTISIDSRSYMAHVLAWIYCHGVRPNMFIDHINCVKSDNRISNLREVSKSENSQNIKVARTTSKTKLLGVSPNWNKFMSRICVGGKQYYLGLFDTAEQAHSAYIEAKRRLHKACTI